MNRTRPQRLKIASDCGFAFERKDGFEGSGFYGYFRDFANRASQRQLALEKALKFKVGDLGTYGEETREW